MVFPKGIHFGKITTFLMNDSIFQKKKEQENFSSHSLTKKYNYEINFLSHHHLAYSIGNLFYLMMKNIKS